MPSVQSSSSQQARYTQIFEALLRWPDATHDDVSSSARSCPAGLSPIAQKVIDCLNAVEMPNNLIPSQVREFRKTNGNPFDIEPSSNIDIEPLSIALPDRTLEARIYRPKKNASTASLVYYHGGGFVLGDLDGYENVMVYLAQLSNVNIISVGYRLAPETPFPGAVNDTVESFSWLHANAGRLQLDPHTMAIGGDSAGGNLATVACHILRDQGRPLPAMQMLIYPSTIGNRSSESREKFAEGLFLTKASIRWFHDHYIDHEQQSDPRFDVLEADDLSQLPPAFIVTAGFDPLRDEGLLYTQTLNKHGVVAIHRCYTSLFHSFMNFGVIPEAKAALGDFARLLKESLVYT